MTNLLFGIWNALSPENLIFGLIGALLGTITGVLPGLGPTSTIAILLPITASLPAIPAIIMLSGIYYGAQYGGSTTSILMNIPGEASSVPTTYDGYPMAKQGRGGPALAIAALGSFFGGTVGCIALTITGPLLASIAFLFGPPEYAAMLLFSLVSMAVLSGDSILKGLLMTLLGIILSSIGLSLNGVPTFTYGSVTLLKGLDLISIIIGVFGISEVVLSLEEQVKTIGEAKLGKLMPSFRELRNCISCTLRATGIGFFLGLLPGMGPTMSTFMAYDVEKKINKNRANFGKGAIEGVCAPETANNANAQAGFIPLLTFGLPPTPTFAVLLAGLTMHGVEPGPALFIKYPEFIWTVVGGMYVGNVLLLILNLPLVGLWAKIVYIPYKLLAPIILGICFLGTYVLRNEIIDVLIAVIFGGFGYILKKADWPIAPVVLGFLLGPMFEAAMRPTLTLSGGSLAILFTRPIALMFMSFTMLVVAGKYVFMILKAKKEWNKRHAT
jgi:putative tricarboxylic transport membrane protein